MHSIADWRVRCCFTLKNDKMNNTIYVDFVSKIKTGISKLKEPLKEHDIAKIKIKPS